MSEFKEINIKDVSENLISQISDNWMLVTAGDNVKYNTMTASWGGFGYLWNRPVAISVIRPQRYTYVFIEKYDTFSLCFFDKKYRDILNTAGSKSGRDFDKMHDLGLTAVFNDNAVYFNEADLTVICKKEYYQDLLCENFFDKTNIDKFYPNNDFHRMYIGSVMHVYKKV